MRRSERFELRVSSAEKATWDAAAVHAGFSLSDWMRAHLNAAVALPAPQPDTFPVW